MSARCGAWAYERSTQEYVAIRQQLAEPDPLRLQHRSLIKDCVRAVVLQPDGDAQTVLAHYACGPVS